MKRIFTSFLVCSMILTMGVSSFAGAYDTQVNESPVIETYGMACPHCGGSTTTTKKEQGDWTGVRTEACPQGKMGCLHMIQQQVTTYYYKCKECGRVTGNTIRAERDLGCFSGSRHRCF